MIDVTSDKIVYYEDLNIIEITEDVNLVDNKNKINLSSSKIVYDKNNNLFKLIGKIFLMMN